MPLLPVISKYIELRTNWRIYAEEFCNSLTKLTGAVMAVERINPNNPISAFEEKYVESNHDLFRLRYGRLDLINSLQFLPPKPYLSKVFGTLSRKARSPQTNWRYFFTRPSSNYIRRTERDPSFSSRVEIIFFSADHVLSVK